MYVFLSQQYYCHYQCCCYYWFRFILQKFVVFQTKLGEECSSLQAAVNVLNCKLESCHKKLEAREGEVEELRCQAMEYCNMLEVSAYDISNYAALICICVMSKV